MMMSKLLEKLRTDVEKLEGQAQFLRSQLREALIRGDEKRASRLEQDLERVERRLTLVGEALAEAQAEADLERARQQAAEEARRAALATAYDAQNRQAAETLAGLCLLGLEVLLTWQNLRGQAVAEAGRLPAPLDLRPRNEWRKVLEGILKTLVPLLGGLSPAIPGDLLQAHAWRAQALEALAKSLQPPLRDLAVAGAEREREAAGRRPAPDRKGLVQALSGRDRSGVSPLPLTGPEVPRSGGGGS
jgi:hypothetical protein